MTTEKKAKVGLWSEEKLELLSKYLHAYTTIMARQTWCKNYYYIDAFAGQGWWLAGDEGEHRVIKGSPAIALETEPPFSWYIFIEQDVERVKELEGLKDRYPERAKRLQVIQGDANYVLQQRIIPRVQDHKANERGFIFLDPYTTNVEWDTIRLIQQTGVLEIFLNFPIMAPNREVLWSNPDKVNQDALERMDRFWGSASWRSYVYEETQTIFGPVQHKVAKAGERLAQVFQGRLGELFDQVTTPVIMKNSKNSALYCLIFAGPKESGKHIAQDVFDKYLRSKSPLKPKRQVKVPPKDQGALDI